MPTITIFGAFLAGLLSFLSPCVLPLAPIYLAQLVGPGIRHTSQSPEPHALGASVPAKRRARGEDPFASALPHATAFIAGFSLAFIALGATASVLGAFLAAHATPLRQAGGLLLIGLGLHLAGFLRLPILDREWRFSFSSRLAARTSYPFSFVVGLVFGLGWTPCVGPILAAILVLAAQAGTLGAGVLLLAAYSLGLGLPFLALALAIGRLGPLLKRLSPHLRSIEVGTGLLLALVGIVICFNWLVYLSAWLRPPFLHLA